MHILYFVMFDKEDASDSREARKAAHDVLIEENFCFQDSIFGRGKADSFVVGGSWAGIFQMLKEGIDEHDLAKLPEKQRHTKRIEKGGKVPCSWNDSCREEGYDDAVIVDEFLYQKLAEKYFDVEVYDANDRIETTIQDMENIVNRWLIAIDYHS